MKTEITNEQVHETYTYKQAVKVAELVAIPELSKSSQTYLATLDEYRETLSELNKSAFGRWTHINAYSEETDLNEFHKNVLEFQEIRKTLDKAEQLHSKIAQAVENGTHARYIEEDTERQQAIMGKNDIVANARRVARTYLEEQAREQAKREKAKERAITKNILKAN